MKYIFVITILMIIVCIIAKDMPKEETERLEHVGWLLNINPTYEVWELTDGKKIEVPIVNTVDYVQWSITDGVKTSDTTYVPVKQALPSNTIKINGAPEHTKPDSTWRTDKTGKVLEAVKLEVVK